LGIDPVAYTKSLAEKGLVKISPKRSQGNTPYVAITLTDEGYLHFGLTKPDKPKLAPVANKQLDSIMADIKAGKPITILRKVAKK
jgi:chromosome segregation and condensation protein ScpB